MRKTILLLLLASTLTTWASTYNYLTIATTAAESSVALSTIKKITFSGSNLVVTTIDGEETSVALSNLNRLYFSEKATAVRNLHAGKLAYQNGRIVAGTSGVLTVYNASGAIVRQMPVAGGRTEMNLSTLPTGIYIVKLGQQTLKIAK